MSKTWEHPWSIDDIVDNASNWSLAGDAGLLKHLEALSQDIFKNADETDVNINKLLNELDSTAVHLDLVKNEFLSLQNTQFIESRVYDDDESVDDATIEDAEKKRNVAEEEKINIKNAVFQGIEILDRCYERVTLPASDSEEENDVISYVLRPKDPYLHRPLPYVIGSDDWYKSWHVGLEDSGSESEEKIEDQFSDSDSESNLPITDRRTISTSDSGTEFGKQTYNDAISTDSEDYNNYVSNKEPSSSDNFAEQLASKLGNVVQSTRETEEPVVNTRPIQKVPVRMADDLFSNEPPPLDDLVDDLEDRQAQGIFSGGQDLFNNVENDEESFWGQKPTKQHIEQDTKRADINNKHADNHDYLPTSVVTKTSSSKTTKGLFDEDESDDDNIFSTQNQSKSYLKPFKPAPEFVDDEPPEFEPVKKKPIGGVPMVGTNENSGKTGLAPFLARKRLSSSDDSETEQPPSQGKHAKIKTDLTDPNKSDNVEKHSMIPEKLKPKPKKLSLFDDNDDLFHDELFSNLGAKKFSSNLFDDIGNDDVFETREPNSGKKKLSLFDDEDEGSIGNSGLFEQTSKEGLFDEDVENDIPKIISGSDTFDGDVHFGTNTGYKTNEKANGKIIFIVEPLTKKKPSRDLFDEDSSDDDLFANSSKSTAVKETDKTDDSVGLFNAEFNSQNDSNYKEDFINKESVVKAKRLFDVDDDETSSEASLQTNDTSYENGSDIGSIRVFKNNDEIKVNNEKKLLTNASEVLQKITELNIPKTDKNSDIDNTNHIESEETVENVFIPSKRADVNESGKPEIMPKPNIIENMTETLDNDTNNLKEKSIEINENSITESNKGNEGNPYSFNQTESNNFTTSISDVNLYDSTPPPDPDDWDAKSETNIFDDEDIYDPIVSYNPNTTLFDTEPPSLDPYIRNSSSGLFDEEPPALESNRSDNKVKTDADTFGGQQMKGLFDGVSSDEDVFAGSNVRTPIITAESFGTTKTEIKNAQVKRIKSVEDTSADKRVVPSKIKHNLNINVAALMPGMRLPTSKKESPMVKSHSLEEGRTETDEAAYSNDTLQIAQSCKDVRAKFEDETETLYSATKTRAKIATKRKPSTRRARHAAIKQTREGSSEASQENNPSVISTESNNSPKESPQFQEDINDNDIFSSPQTNKKVSSEIPEDVSGDKMNPEQDTFSQSPQIQPIKSSSLFEDSDSETTDTKSKKPNSLFAGTESLFDDDEDYDLFSKKTPEVKAAAKKVGGALFDYGSDDDDIFAVSSTKPKMQQKEPQPKTFTKTNNRIVRKTQERELLEDPLDALQKRNA